MKCLDFTFTPKPVVLCFIFSRLAIGFRSFISVKAFTWDRQTAPDPPNHQYQPLEASPFHLKIENRRYIYSLINIHRTSEKLPGVIDVSFHGPICCSTLSHVVASIHL